MSEPVGYLLTWTCYGTWLHGDERGSVDRQHANPGHETLSPNTARTRAAAARMSGPPFELSTEARALVRAALIEHAAVCRWPIDAVNVRTAHVHVVVGNVGVPPERMMNSFKAWATRKLRSGRCVAAEAAVWTRHGSTRHLWDEASVARAVEYVVDGQDLPR